MAAVGAPEPVEVVEAKITIPLAKAGGFGNEPSRVPLAGTERTKRGAVVPGVTEAAVAASNTWIKTAEEFGLLTL